MDELGLSNKQRQILLDQRIDISQPGTVLADFQMLLDALGTEGFEAAGKHKLLPMAWIDDLDQRLSRPLRLTMKRPQLRSHPYLQGLFLLLRASGLSHIQGSASKARVVLDPTVLSCWNTLNSTEQYFTLLEAWLAFGKPEMVGEREGRCGEFLFCCHAAWSFSRQPEFRRSLDDGVRYIHGIGTDLYLVALLHLFGLMDVTFPSVPTQPWWPASTRFNELGDAIMTLLSNEVTSSYFWEDVPQSESQVTEASAEDETEPMAACRFGRWQSLFQPYFPEWQRKLEILAEPAREGELQFRVSLGKSVWRQIAIRADATLEELASWILNSVNFSEDHLYEFVIRNRFGAVERFLHPECDEGPFVDELEVGQLPLEVGESMQFHFDFGDDWRFDVKLEEILPGPKKSKTARIIKKHGESPEQYPDYDD